MDPRNITLQQMRYVVAVDEHKSFSRAAEACLVVQSTLSASIKNLEDHIGAQLFERDQKSVRTTELGQTFVRIAQAILNETALLAQKIEGGKGTLPLQLRIGIIPTIAAFISPKAFKHTQQTAPSTLHIREQKSADIVENIKTGTLDIGIMAVPYPLDACHTSIHLTHDPFYLACSKQHPLSFNEVISAEQIPVEELILLEGGHCLRNHTLEVCTPKQARDQSYETVGSVHTAINMVAAGMGVFLLPEVAIPSFEKRDDITIVPIKGGLARTLVAVVRSHAPHQDYMHRIALSLTGKKPLQLSPSRLETFY